VPEPCPVCHTPISPNATVCPHCGEPLAAATSIHTWHYTPQDLIVDLNILAVFWVMLIVLNVFNPHTMFLTASGVVAGSYIRRLRGDHTGPTPKS
jgi:predicted nucleic acid-binding Zn ribbon protein